VQGTLAKLGGVCLPLPFDRGYHTEAFSDASSAFLDYYKQIKLGPPKIPLYSCASVGLFPGTASGVRKLAAAQWSTKVRFRETIEKMYEDGVRLFVEVGPSANLTAFVQDILGKREFLSLASNVRRRNEIEQLLQVFGQLYVAGRGPVMASLFAGRAIAVIDLDGSPKPLRGTVIDNTMPMVRLTPADCDAIREITARGAPMPAQFAATAQAAPIGSQPVHSEDNGRAQVMGDYLTVMRGFLDQQQSMLTQWMGVEAPALAPAAMLEPALFLGASTHANDSPTPLLDAVLEHDASRVLARSQISMFNDNFVRHHVMTGPVSESDPHLFGLSCVPLSVSMELMAEACALLAGRTDLAIIENIRAFDWIALDEDEVTVDIEAEVVDRDRGHYRASVGTSRGTALTAEFRFEPDWHLPALPELQERRASCWNAPDLYTTGMFHGPIFQSLQYIDAWDDSGIDVRLSDGSLSDFFADGHTPRLILNPVILDALGQVVACWLVQFFGTEFNNFPSTIARIELYETCPTDRRGLVMKTRQRPVDGVATNPGAPRAWQFECVDAEGRVLLRGHDLINVFWQMPSAYHAVRWRPLLGWLGGPVTTTAGETAAWEVPVLAADFLSQSGAICLRTLAHTLLSVQEREEWRGLPGNNRSRIDWLFGRAAIKEAVRHWLYERTGHLLYPTDIVDAQDAQGIPVVDGRWRDSLSGAPTVSLSSTGGIYRVGVAPPPTDGSDLEPALNAQAFSRTFATKELVQ
jgi:hypothetical protein